MPVFGIDLPKLLLLPCFCTAGMVGARREKPSAVVAETAEGLYRPVIMMGHERSASLDNSGLSQNYTTSSGCKTVKVMLQ